MVSFASAGGRSGNVHPAYDLTITAPPLYRCAAPMQAATGVEEAFLLESVRSWAYRIRRDAITLWFACRRTDTPWVAKAIGLFVVAYALSPIDLIPDFIPVLGWLDELLLLPALIWLAVRLLPEPVLRASRADAERWIADRRQKPRSLFGAAMVVTIWLLALVLGWYLLVDYWALGGEPTR